jgi:PAS domain S-box-containing protein
MRSRSSNAHDSRAEFARPTIMKFCVDEDEHASSASSSRGSLDASGHEGALMHLHTLLEHMPLPLALVCGKGTIVESSPGLHELLGYRGEELQGIALDDLVRSDRAAARRSLRALFDVGSSYEQLATVLRRDGSTADVRLRAWPEDDGSARCAAMLFEPCTHATDETTVLDRMTDGFVAFDRRWRFTFVNRAAEEYFQRPRIALLGRVVWDALPRTVGTAIEREYRRAAASPVPVEFELVTPLRQRLMQFRAYPSPTGVSIYFHDVTDQRRAEDALRESEARFRALFENVMDGILVSAPDGGVHAANPAACAMLGRTEAEIRAIGRDGIVADDGRLEAMLALRRREGRARGELAYVHADGTTFPVEIASTNFLDPSGAERTSIVFRDLSEPKRAEERERFVADATAALAESLDVEETLATITSLIVPRLADLCLVDLFADGGLVRAAVVHRDPASFGDFEELRKHAPDLASEVPIARAARTGQPELVPVVTDAWIRSIAESEAHYLAMKKAQMRSVLVVPMVTSGRTLGVLALISSEPRRIYGETDLTYAMLLAHRAAVALAHARTYDEAVRARRARDDLLAIVSHDLRAPLNVIQLSASVLDREKHTEEAAAILRGVARANRLIQDLLIVTRLDAGQLPLERRDEAPEALLAEMLDLFGAAAREKGVAFAVHAEAGLPTLWVDRHRIHQVLANLVGNALKFTGAGGRIEVRAQRDGPNVRIEVTDTGAGIASDALEHVFDRFWQAAHARRAGAGLGLAIAKGIVEEHGGTIAIESELGRGTRASVVLPVARA